MELRDDGKVHGKVEVLDDRSVTVDGDQFEMHELGTELFQMVRRSDGKVVGDFHAIRNDKGGRTAWCNSTMTLLAAQPWVDRFYPA